MHEQRSTIQKPYSRQELVAAWLLRLLAPKNCDFRAKISAKIWKGAADNLSSRRVRIFQNWQKNIRYQIIGANNLLPNFYLKLTKGICRNTIWILFIYFAEILLSDHGTKCVRMLQRLHLRTLLGDRILCSNSWIWFDVWDSNEHNRTQSMLNIEFSQQTENVCGLPSTSEKTLCAVYNRLSLKRCTI